MTPFYGIIVVGNYFTTALWDANGKMIWRSTRLYQTKGRAWEAVKLLACEHAASQTPYIIDGKVVFS